MNGFIKGLGFSDASRAERWSLLAIGVLFAFFAILNPGTGGKDSIAESKAVASEILETSAIEQCKTAITARDHRARFGFNAVMTNDAGDVLVEQPFTAPVFGLIERDEFIARCALRKNGRFEFSVS